MPKLSRFKLDRIVDHLHGGGLIAYPTEAVYGIGCDPLDAQAVMSLLELKQRDIAKGLILVAANLQQLSDYIQPLSSSMREQLEHSWPGPITWLIPAATETPSWLTGQHATLACRVSAEPMVAQLCEAFGTALVSTSANLSGLPPSKTALQVRRQFHAADDLEIINGSAGQLQKPTALFDLTTGKQLR